jgi:putative acetyltransferase
VIRIESAETPEFVATIRKLFVEYSESLEVDLCFQGFPEELAKLPGDGEPIGIGRFPGSVESAPVSDLKLGFSRTRDIHLTQVSME